MSTELHAGKNRITQLDFVRVFLMLGVVTIHVSSTYIFVQSRLSIGSMNLAFYLNQAVRFSVPGFVLLSGLSLSLGKSREPWRKFYAGRVKKVLIPYLLWYTVYALWYVYLNGGAGLGVGWFLRSALTGSTAPHLYFIVIVLQLYLLYPLLRRLSRTVLLMIAFASALVQVTVWLDGAFISFLPPGNPLYLLCVTWLCYFIPPMLLSREQVLRLLAWTKRYMWPLLGLALALSLVVAADGWVLGAYVLSIRPTLFAYTPAVMLATAAVASRLSGEKLLSAVAKLSAMSMDIFFVHVLILDILRSFSIFSRGLAGMFLLYAACLALSVAFALTLRRIKAVIRPGVRPNHPCTDQNR